MSASSMRFVSETSPAPGLAEDRLENLVLRAEVVVEQAVRDAGLLRDVTDA